MKTKVFRWSFLPSIGFLLSGVIGLTGCDASKAIQSATVRLNKTHVTIEVGDCERLSASVSKGYSSELVWFSSNESVAVVDEGYVFGVGEGEAKVTAAYGGGYASCLVTVGDSGTGPVSGPKLNLNVTNKTMKVGESFDLTVTSVNPEDTTVRFSVGDTNVVSITEKDAKTVTVTGSNEGTTGVTVQGSNGVTKVCQVTVSNSSAPGTDYNIAVDTNLNYSGSLTIGSPKNQRTFMEGLLADFNKYTNSKISFTIADFEESNGTSGYNSAKAMPAVFPYASDQTMTLYNFDALDNIPTSNVTWIRNNMGGNDIVKAATYSKVVGYPFASDNGLVMFYNKSVISDPAMIDTWDKISTLANSKGMDINYKLNDGFLLAPALMSYNGGEPLYVLTPGDNKTYTAESHFNSDEGLTAAKVLRNIIKDKNIRNANDAPRGDVLVTITDSSKVENFKKNLSSNYAVAPLPYISEGGPRLGSFLGYKFYGVNMQLGGTAKTMAHNVAKFLCSEYAQYKRYQAYYVKPTLDMSMPEIHAEFRTAVEAEPHIAALIEQSKNNGVIPMRAVSSSLWSQTMVTYDSLADLAANAADSKYIDILKALDKGLKK